MPLKVDANAFARTTGKSSVKYFAKVTMFQARLDRPVRHALGSAVNRLGSESEASFSRLSSAPQAARRAWAG